MIKGIHHVSMKCSNQEDYEKTIHFYMRYLQDAYTNKAIMLSQMNMPKK